MSDDERSTVFDLFAVVGRALGSGKRLELLDLIAQRERTVGSLAELTGMGLSTTSAHLQVLKRARLVSTRRAETYIYYDLADDNVAALYVLLQKVAWSQITGPNLATPGFQTAVDTEVLTIDRQELLTQAESGTVLVLDVRPGDEYLAGHIPGAVSIPLEQLEQRMSEVPSDVDVVVYGRGQHCGLAQGAVPLLRANERRAKRLNYGMIDWRIAAKLSRPAQQDEGPSPAGTHLAQDLAPRSNS